jgi:hypothetical protein
VALVCLLDLRPKLSSPFLSLFNVCAPFIIVQRLCTIYHCSTSVHHLSFFNVCAPFIIVQRLCTIYHFSTSGTIYHCSTSVHHLSLFNVCALFIIFQHLCTIYHCSTFEHHLSLFNVWAPFVTILNAYFSFTSLRLRLVSGQNYLVYGLCTSSRYLNTRKHNVLETGSVSVLRCGGRHLLCCVP